VAADVLCYFGELGAFARAARAALQAGGLLAFTVEYDADPGRLGYRLQLNGRYRHGEPYVRGCLENAGFANIVIALADLRLEGGAPVQGLVVTAWASL
jgi:predicted TPR repeat methyltransferase